MIGKIPGVLANIILGELGVLANSTSSLCVLHCNILTNRNKEPVSLKNVLDEVIQIIDFTKS